MKFQARLEAQQGHEHSQHAILARLKKEQDKLQNKNSNTSQEQAMPTATSVQASTSSPQTSPFGRRRSFGKAHTPPEVRRSNRPHTPPEIQRNSGSNEAAERKERTTLSDDVVADGVIDASPVMERKHVKTPNTSHLQPEDRKISAPVHLGQSATKPLSSSGNGIPERSQTPPPSKIDKNSVVVSTQQNVMSLLPKSASDPNLAAKESRKHETVSKRDSHEDEDWYMPGIPRLAMLSHNLQCPNRLFLSIL